MTLGTHSTTDYATILSGLINDVRSVDCAAADALDAEASFDVGCLLSAARDALSKARDVIMAAEPRTVVRSRALDAAYAAADELFS